MPVQAHDFDDLVAAPAAGEKARLHVIEMTLPHLSGGDEQKNHADCHVGAVKSCNHEKARAKLRCAHRVAPGTYAFFDQLGPFEGLHTDERSAEHGGHKQQDSGHFPVFFITELDRHSHGAAAADEYERHDGDQDQREMMAKEC